MKKKIVKFILITAAILAAMYKITEYINKLAVSKKVTKESEINVYEWKFGAVRFKKLGSGSPIVLLHSLSPEMSGKEWDKIAESLAENNTVYIPDLPGCGDSDKPNTMYSNFLYVKMINDFVKDVVGEKALVIASAASSPLIISASKYEPKLYEKIILVNPCDPTDIVTEKFDAPIISKIASKILALPIVGKFLYNILVSKKVLDYKYKDSIVCAGDEETEKFIEDSYISAHIDNGDGRFLLINIMDGMMNFDVSHCLETAEAKPVIIYGELSKLNDDSINEYSRHVEDEDLWVIPDSSEIPHFENPEEFVNTVKEYL